jgi:hypothetical protein
MGERQQRGASQLVGKRITAKRRRLLQFLAAGAALPMRALAQSPRVPGEWQLEWQRSDAEIEFEALAFDPVVARPMARARFEPRDMVFGASLVAQASQWVGKGRSNAKDEIAKLLALFDLPYANGDRPVPFCAAGASYVAASVYAKRSLNDDAKLTLQAVGDYLGDVDHYHFVPTPSVWDMFYGAMAKRRWRAADPPKLVPKPGWLVIFDFGKGADHVGIVERYASGVINTIEFNTVPENAVGSEANGGMVARRRRSYLRPMIKGFVRTDLAL